MREVDRQCVFRKLGVQPIQEFQIEQRVKREAVFDHCFFGQDLRVDKPGILGFADQSSLREGAAQSARERGFAVEHAARQLSIDDRIGKDEPTTRLEHAIQLAKRLTFFGGQVDDAV